MAFPTSPTNGQQANINGITYTYSSAATAWTVSTSVSNTFVSINVSANVNSGNVLATGLISATGNITGGNVLGGANVNATTHTGTTVSVTANVTGGNILTGGLISAAGNISANNATFTSNQTLSYGTANGVIYLDSSKVLTTGSALVFDGTNFSTTGTATATKLIPTGTSVTGNGVFLPTTDTLGFSTAGAEQMRISSSVNGIVTVGPRAASVGGFGTDYATIGVWNSVGGGYRIYRGTGAGTAVCNFYGDGSGVNLFALEASTPLIFGTAGAEKARIDSIGNLLVGTTTASGKFVSSTTATIAYSGYFVNNYTGDGVYSYANANNTTYKSIACSGSSGINFYVYSNGTYGTVSDQRLKKNIETTRDGYIDDIMKLRVVKYNWISDDDGTPKELGWIAQELEQVFPNLVQDSQPDENGDTRKEVKTSVLPFILLKAIQEQQALITQLTARITALEEA